MRLVRESTRIAINLLSVASGRSISNYSNGLKDIAGWLGFKWSDQDVSGVQLLRCGTPGNKPKRRWRRKNSSLYLEDCAALELAPVRCTSLPTRSPAKFGSAQSLEIVVADNLDSKVSLCRDSRVPSMRFESINKAARGITSATPLHPIRLQVERAKERHETSEKDHPHYKVVVCEPLRACPRCQERQLRRFGKYEVPPDLEI